MLEQVISPLGMSKTYSLQNDATHSLETVDIELVSRQNHVQSDKHGTEENIPKNKETADHTQLLVLSTKSNR